MRFHDLVEEFLIIKNLINEKYANSHLIYLLILKNLVDLNN
jgi:hypothetical protein